ncbi:hypothetical protein [Sphingopyxis yananensis]|uniref:hypothetical protein n=1 Tax=Sphingopyxis yananensis TaxID=2886687 RepID=UPI001D10F30A|nr:hypothetical protein [Sphingopyxis yananensis]MCC2602830.1 hypothetical protein [Sphingopyxis yananensis]
MTPTYGSRGSWWRQAPALRFLAIFLLGWVGLRALFPLVPAFWFDDVSARALAERPLEQVPHQRTLPAPHTVPPAHATGVPRYDARNWAASYGGQRALGPFVHARGRQAAVVERFGLLEVGSGGDAAGKAGAVMDAAPAMVLAQPVAAKPTQAHGMSLTSRPANAAAPPAMMIPPPVRSVPADGDGAAFKVDRLSASAWVFLRDNLANRPNNLPVAGELGGSQAGLRVAYELDGAQIWQLYGRGSVALGHVAQSEAAIGISAKPVAALPVRLAIERRQKLGREGRSAMAAMIVGGVSGQSLPAKFRLDTYGQAGVVGVQKRDAFVDGAVVVDRAVRLRNEAQSLRLGVVVAGASQPDVSRLDIGPRITLPLPKFGKGMRVSLDWRHRVAGNAQPKNGAALTLGADF